MKLNAYSFYQTDSFTQEMIDSVAVRVKENNQLMELKPADTLDFIEALSVLNRENRQMSGHLAKILKTTNHVFLH